MTRTALIRWSAHLVAMVGLALEMGTVVLVARAVATGQSVPIYPYTAAGFVLGAAFPIIGWVIASRRPGNAIGWIFLAIGLSQALDTFNGQYSTYGLATSPGSLPFAAEAAWAGTWDWAPGFVLLVTLSVVLFPDGRLPSPRWRLVTWITALGLLLMVLPTAIAVWPHRGIELTGYSGSYASPDPAVEIAGALLVVGLLLSALAALLSVAGLIVRFRRSSGVERQQLKWFTFGGAIEIVVFAVTPFLVELDPSFLPVIIVAGALVAPLLPVAAGIAVLRYRLYEIDRIISRTLAYTALTAALAVVYIGAFIGLQAVLAPLTTGGGSLAVAASTLVVFLLFQPLRQRLQSAMDRRFNRSRYDAQQTVEGFAARLRDEVDLIRLAGEVQTVVGQTLAPDSVGVWFRPSNPASGR